MADNCDWVFDNLVEDFNLVDTVVRLESDAVDFDNLMAECNLLLLDTIARLEEAWTELLLSYPNLAQMAEASHSASLKTVILENKRRVANRQREKEESREDRSSVLAIAPSSADGPTLNPCDFDFNFVVEEPSTTSTAEQYTFEEERAAEAAIQTTMLRLEHKKREFAERKREATVDEEEETSEAKKFITQRKKYFVDRSIGECTEDVGNEEAADAARRMMADRIKRKKEELLEKRKQEEEVAALQPVGEDSRARGLAERIRQRKQELLEEKRAEEAAFHKAEEEARNKIIAERIRQRKKELEEKRAQEEEASMRKKIEQKKRELVEKRFLELDAQQLPNHTTWQAQDQQTTPDLTHIRKAKSMPNTSVMAERIAAMKQELVATKAQHEQEFSDSVPSLGDKLQRARSYNRESTPLYLSEEDQEAAELANKAMMERIAKRKREIREKKARAEEEATIYYLNQEKEEAEAARLRIERIGARKRELLEKKLQEKQEALAKEEKRASEAARLSAEKMEARRRILEQKKLQEEAELQRKSLEEEENNRRQAELIHLIIARNKAKKAAEKEERNKELEQMKIFLHTDTEDDKRRIIEEKVRARKLQLAIKKRETEEAMREKVRRMQAEGRTAEEIKLAIHEEKKHWGELLVTQTTTVTTTTTTTTTTTSTSAGPILTTGT